MLTLPKNKSKVRCTLPYNCIVRRAVMRIGQYEYPMIQIEWPAMEALRKKNPDLVGLPSIFAMNKGFLETFPGAAQEVKLDVTIERGKL
jgi:hypothetical protein